MKGNNRIAVLLAAVLFTVAGFATGWFFSEVAWEKAAGKEARQHNKNKVVETRGGGYQFVNPLWECDNFNPSQLNSIVKLRTDLHAFVKVVLDNKSAEYVSVYFRDLNSGPWLGINERENFSPASLLKVPILIAMLKKAEANPGYLQKKLVYSKPFESDVVANITDTLLVVGQSYTIEDLLLRMIAYSDNEAKQLVLNDVGDLMLVNVMKDIGIDITGLNAGDDFITVKDYSSFFRLLYNATYLNKDMSEKALEILSKTSYKHGIVAGIAKGISISHKFGERAFSDSNIRQLHDCGIIYRTGSPYLLCVMTRGTDFNELASIIAGVSEIVYKNTIVVK